MLDVGRIVVTLSFAGCLISRQSAAPSQCHRACWPIQPTAPPHLHSLTTQVKSARAALWWPPGTTTTTMWFLAYDAPVALQVEAPAQAARGACEEELCSQKAPLQQPQPQQQQQRAAVPSRTGSDGLPRGSVRQQRGPPSVVQRPAQQEPSPPKVGALTRVERVAVLLQRRQAGACEHESHCSGAVAGMMGTITCPGGLHRHWGECLVCRGVP